MDLMGSKTRSREAMQKAGVPVVPGTFTALESSAAALDEARRISFPIMLKAAGGGGGKGMRLVESADALPSAFEQARDEARRSFGNPDIYIEKALVSPRHIEVQVLADEHGGVIHLGERECSIQRRHQKVLEEAPSPLVDARPEMRKQITAAGVQAAKAADYSSAGTVEFLVDAEDRFYFLEMNTRLQVEHPVTEMTTGMDLVKEQILIAAGQRLRRRQEDIPFRGSALECRVYAEDPDNNFFPSPGRITRLEEPSGPGVRVDSGVYSGWDVPVEYDPLLAKLVVWAPNRPEAIDRLRAALAEYRIGGIRTTLPFFHRIVDDPEFQAGRIDTGFIQQQLSVEGKRQPADGEERIAAFAAGLHFLKQSRTQAEPGRPNGSVWKVQGKRALLR
jgi:acetyl-CoA carboxylase biotin carboxylase subunit